MSTVITAEQGNVLYDGIVTQLTGVDALWRAVDDENFGKADELARALADSLTFLVTDLGWGAGGRDAIELQTDPQIVRRVMTRLRRQAVDWETQEEREAVEVRRDADASKSARENIEEIIRNLDEQRGDR